jgi:hypothetical protein
MKNYIVTAYRLCEVRIEYSVENVEDEYNAVRKLMSGEDCELLDHEVISDRHIVSIGTIVLSGVQPKDLT